MVVGSGCGGRGGGMMLVVGVGNDGGGRCRGRVVFVGDNGGGLGCALSSLNCPAQVLDPGVGRGGRYSIKGGIASQLL